ncbi:nitrate/nitrite transporter [Secundilactobacillus paracollinoides]|uniref:MFS transporter n=1 Tax=Secundilactobacillus paracollinoides TaxID=240427 RepID=A0A1B2IVK7_9LACO|nr:NarK/NasA family nitrate transporter [Secundilactobacillus paracollinoides]ANZ66083.1 MFS transporter [Secundilactobacillus paracollinoides]
MTDEEAKTGSRVTAYTALIVAMLAMAVCFMSWSNFAPLAAQISKMFGLSVSEKTLLLATPVLLGAIMRIPIGILSDKYGGKKVYIILMIFILIPLFMITKIHTYGMLLVAALFVGMAGTSFAVGVSYASAWFPAEKQGMALGIVGMGNMGNAIAALTLPRISASHGFNSVYHFLMILTVIAIVVFAIFCKEMPTHREKTFASAFSVAKESSTWYLSLFYFLTFGLFVSFSNLTPTFLGDSFGINAVTAGLYAALFAAVCTIIRPIGGTIADKRRPMSMLQWVFVFIAIFALVIMFSFNSQTLFVIGLVGIGLAAGIGNGVIFKMVPYVSKGNTGAVTGFVGALGALGGFFPPLVVGWIKQWTGSYQIGVFLLVLMAVLCYYVLWRRFIHGDVHIVK